MVDRRWHCAAMTRPLLTLAFLAVLPLVSASPVLAQASAAVAAGKVAPSPLSPGEIVAAAPKAEWSAIAASDLLVMDLAPGANAKPRRVVIQLMPPPFSQGWIGNIRKLAAAHWWDGLSVNRVQDNYVAQWGDANGDDKAKAKALPAGLAVMQESAYSRTTTTGEPGSIVLWHPRKHLKDSYADWTWFAAGWPMGIAIEDETRSLTNWPVHCYGMVGVGRDLSPNTGNGAELYTVIGHAPRHLDRNIALVGRVIEGIENLSSLPRGTGPLGFYETAGERTPIVSIKIGNEVSGLPAYEYLSTESATFAKYADARANRRDPFFIRPAGGADICNIPVPVRRVK